MWSDLSVSPMTCFCRALWPLQLCSSCLFSAVCFELRLKGLQTYWSNFVFSCRFLLYVLVCECLPLSDSDTVMHGELHSPQYPEPYPPNALEQWDLTVPEGFQIRLTFTHLDIEASDGCYYDSLTVRKPFFYSNFKLNFLKKAYHLWFNNILQ